MSLKLTLTAMVVGTALACALLGLQAPSAGMFAGRPIEHGVVQQPEPAGVLPQQHKEATPAGHTDGHTGPKSSSVYLSQRLIDGKSTRICTTDPGLHAALVEAVGIWNAELSSLTVLSGVEPLIAHESLRGGAPTDCSDSLFDIDVVLLKGTCPSGGGACYLRDRVVKPPRKQFTYCRTKAAADCRAPAYKSAAHSSIVWKSDNPVSIPTLLHELGHVLGLTDYESCEDLRRGPDKTTGLDQPGDVDPLDDHFSLMRNNLSADCRHRGAITGRDLRDLYESYRVEPITGVRLDGNAPLSAPKTLTFTLFWGTDGAAEAAHNASHIAVLRRSEGSSVWHTLGTPMKVQKAGGSVRDGLRVTDREAPAAAYKIVGLTRGDIRLQGSFDISRQFTVQGEKAGTTVTGKFAEGDPTMVVGVTSYTETGSKRIEVDGPAVLSASLSPRYCYVNR